MRLTNTEDNEIVGAVMKSVESGVTRHLEKRSGVGWDDSSEDFTRHLLKLHFLPTNNHDAYQEEEEEEKEKEVKEEEEEEEEEEEKEEEEEEEKGELVVCSRMLAYVRVTVIFARLQGQDAAR
ncbi:hypothetical protein M0804_000709 [Polistes exclamans]|nr:hypothetical protein M0804_000709 [Polistes exclamans]